MSQFEAIKSNQISVISPNRLLGTPNLATEVIDWVESEKIINDADFNIQTIRLGQQLLYVNDKQLSVGSEASIFSALLDAEGTYYECVFRLIDSITSRQFAELQTTFEFLNHNSVDILSNLTPAIRAYGVIQVGNVYKHFEIKDRYTCPLSDIVDNPALYERTFVDNGKPNIQSILHTFSRLLNSIAATARVGRTIGDIKPDHILIHSFTHDGATPGAAIIDPLPTADENNIKGTATYVGWDVLYNGHSTLNDLHATTLVLAHIILGRKSERFTDSRFIDYYLELLLEIYTKIQNKPVDTGTTITLDSGSFNVARLADGIKVYSGDFRVDYEISTQQLECIREYFKTALNAQRGGKPTIAPDQKVHAVLLALPLIKIVGINNDLLELSPFAAKNIAWLNGPFQEFLAKWLSHGQSQDYVSDTKLHDADLQRYLSDLELEMQMNMKATGEHTQDYDKSLMQIIEYWHDLLKLMLSSTTKDEQIEA